MFKTLLTSWNSFNVHFAIFFTLCCIWQTVPKACVTPTNSNAHTSPVSSKVIDARHTLQIRTPSIVCNNCTHNHIKLGINVDNFSCKKKTALCFIVLWLGSTYCPKGHQKSHISNLFSWLQEDSSKMPRTTCKLKLAQPSELTMGSADTLLSWKIFRATMIGVSGDACGRKEQPKG